MAKSNGGEAVELFNKPAVKLFCRQLKDCQKSTSHAESTQQSWLVPLKNSLGNEIHVEVHLMWLQGVIHSVISPAHVILKDSSGGIIKVIDCDKLASGQTWIKKGVYCSVIGVLVSSSQTPQLRAIKMTSLEDNPHLQALWDWEVKDLANLLYMEKS